MTAFLASSLFSFAGYGAWLTWLSGEGRPLKAPCEAWLAQPTARWLALQGCLLAVDDLLLESEAGDLETLANRRHGISTTLSERPPRWVAAWAPVTSLDLRGRAVRALFRLESKDVVAWLNAFEQADDRRREAMWADPVVLRRVATPGLLAGEAVKPTTDALYKALGTRGSVGLLTVLPGEPPPRALPAWAILSVLGGLGLSWLAWRFFNQSARGDEPTAEQVITSVGVGDVKVDLGELEALRREEAAERRRGRPDGG